MNHKKNLGQFNTTNVNFILSGFEDIVSNKDIVDPFAGNGDLLKWAKENNCQSIKGFDVDETKKNESLNIDIRNSLKNCYNYDFVLTNPPYLGKNKYKEEDKSIFNDFEDMYQSSIFSCMNSNEGIFIVPVNFISSDNSKRIRNIFFDKFKITKMKYFSERVFEDTAYNVVAFHYKKLENPTNETSFILEDVFAKTELTIKLFKEYGWKVGGEFTEPIKNLKNIIGAKRLHIKDIEEGEIEKKIYINNTKNLEIRKLSQKESDKIEKSIIILNSIDGLNERLKLEKKQGYDALYSIDTSRNKIQITFDVNISKNEQKKMICIFNEIINLKRDEYNSLFLTNFRENDRKKISFDFVYKLLNFIYLKYFSGIESIKI